MFPTSYTGRFQVQVRESADVDAVLTRVDRALKAAGATGIIRSNNKISFRGGLFRWVWNWNVLVPVGHGEIEVTSGTPVVVTYRFSCVELLVVATAMAGVMGFLARSLTIFLVFWLWLFGMNYVIGAVRLPRFVRKAVAD